VDSAFVGLELAPPPLPQEEMKDFVAFVRLAFAKRRKTVRNSLASGWGREKAEAALAAAGIPERARAEEMGLGELVGVYRSWTLQVGTRIP
jgi:16S rRNA A1518/A1519 N6-dimethyltransferase RsmA/KsgA/DIM1 with predicted DNA glycosylase/AP lyase activity